MTKSTLEVLRKEINSIDGKIVDLLVLRQSLMPQVGKCKKIHKLAINQPEREQELILKYKSIAIKKKLNPKLIEKMFKEIFKDSKRIQKIFS